MSNIVSAKHKIARKLCVNLWGKDNCSFEKKNYLPGQHGQTVRRRMSDYAIQLKAKQMLRFYYGRLSEKQFKNIFKKASQKRGDKVENFIALLESRLDATVYRANFVSSIFAARQFVSHKHVTVNGEIVNIASYTLKVGDVVQVREKSREMNMVIESLEKMERDIPPYLELDRKEYSVKLLQTPLFADVPYPVEMKPSLVIELYSR